MSLSTGDLVSQLMPIVLTASGGFIVGFLIGYGLKKFLKIVAAILGLFLLGLLALNYTGIITINYATLEELVIKAVSLVKKEAGKFVNWLTISVPFSGGLIAGLVLGFKKG